MWDESVVLNKAGGGGGGGRQGMASVVRKSLGRDLLLSPDETCFNNEY